MTKQLKWRLGKLPTPDEVLKLVNDKLITKEEARDILFNEETVEGQTIEDAKQEIKFLRELIEKLANKTQIIESIRYIERPYQVQPWYRPYGVWAGGIDSLSNNTMLCGASSTLNLTALAGQCVSDVSFSAIS